MSATEAKSGPTAREIDPAALRAFSRRFIGAKLTGFYALNQAGKRHHVFHFEGEIATLLGLGLIEERMVPPKPKRKAGAVKENEYWRTERLAGERLRAIRHVTDSTDGARPLARYSPSNYPFLETVQEAREEYRRELARITAHTSDFARSSLRLCLVERWGLRVADEDRARIDAIAVEFGEALRHAGKNARIVSNQPTRLRLVVSNGKVALP